MATRHKNLSPAGALSLKALVLLILGAVLFSCSVQKRHYRKGLYFARNGKAGKYPADHARSEQARQSSAIFTEVLPVKDQAPIADANGKTTALIVLKKPAIHFKSPNDSCDLIVMRTGDEMFVKVLEISSQEIRYRKCSMPDGPLFVSLKRDVFMVKYSNGKKEVFEKVAPVPVREYLAKPPVGKISHPKTPMVYMFAGLTFLFPPFSIGALIVGLKVLRDMKNNPGKFREKELVTLCTIFAGIYVAFTLVIVGLLFASLYFFW